MRVIRLRRIIKTFRPDAILAHTTVPALYTRLFAPKKCNNIIVLHSSGNDYKKLLIRYLGKFLSIYRTRAIVAVSEVAKLKYELFLGSERDIKIINNGSEPMSPKELSSYIEHPKSIITMARISAVKNPSLWSQVASNVNRNYSSTVFEWFGPVSEGEDFSELFSNHCDSRSSRSYFRGAAKSVNGILKAGDILFHPSDREAMPLSILEAIMVGLPIVCSDEVAACVGLDYVDETFPAGDVIAAEAALCRVINDYGKYSERAIVRRFNAADEFSIANCARRYFDLLTDMVET